MSAAALPPPSIDIPDIPRRKRFTREEVQTMQSKGIFEGERLELIDGDLIDKMGQNPPHASCIRLLHQILVRIFGAARIVVQCPIDVPPADQPRNFPEPDLAVLTEDKQDFRRRHPFGDELRLVVEVAESSLSRDMTFKRDLYARARVPEYWVVDLEGRRVVVHRASSQGTYTELASFGEADSIDLADDSIAVSQILP